ncbi:hypothetical protein FJZ17_00130 [Candidatus Pacearchaeota archaeon]|nr:hypothetical protein [Candidatus Pacearchaeota archaeon]
MGKDKKRKGEITIAWIVTIVLLVLGFMMVLIFFYNLGGTGAMDREVCHQSVIFRATIPESTQGFLPLKCKTNKICITSGLLGGECADFIGEKGITRVRVRNEEQIEQIYAQEILDCWSTMGEGKLNLFSQTLAKNFGFGTVSPSCIICTRIAFDKSRIKEPEFDFSKIDVGSYMITHKVPGEEKTYMEYISGAGGLYNFKDSLNSDISFGDFNYQKDGNTLKSEGSSIKPEDLKEPVSDYSAFNKESAIVFMQISAPQYGTSLKNSATALLGGYGASRVLAPTWTKQLASGLFKNPLVALISAAVGIGLQQSNVAYNRQITASYCGDSKIGDDTYEGCSVVRSVDYNVSEIAKYCSNIESIP